MIRGIQKGVGLILYKTFAVRFPVSYSRFFGKLSQAFRSVCVKMILENCGKNINVEKGADFAANITIGNNSGIGKNSVIGAYTTIGNNVMMGEACYIYTRNHKFDRTDIPMCEQGNDSYQPVIIADDVWIGSRVTILPGTKIGTGVVIGAGAVVHGEIPDYAIIGGVPARVIRFRK